MTSQLRTDLDEVLEQTTGLFRALSGARLFVSGGTGFFGCWMLHALTHAVDRLGVDVRAVVLARNPGALDAMAPGLAGHRALRFVSGDVRDFAFPDGGFSHVVHLATTASSTLNQQDPLVTFDVVVGGTRRVLELAEASGAAQVLFTSSGAVYGRQPPEVPRLAEDAPSRVDPLDPKSTYAEGKRAAEQLCQIFSTRSALKISIARGFAFTGAFLPLGGSFAAGAFVKDALDGQPLRIGGDGTPLRSYLYGSDLAVWLWTLLTRAEGCRAYNLGGEAEISIRDLADAVAAASADVFGHRPEVQVAKVPDPSRPPDRYIPSTQRARTELGLRETVTLDDGLRRMLRHHRGH